MIHVLSCGRRECNYYVKGPSFWLLAEQHICQDGTASSICLLMWLAYLGLLGRMLLSDDTVSPSTDPRWTPDPTFMKSDFSLSTTTHCVLSERKTLSKHLCFL